MMDDHPPSPSPMRMQKSRRAFYLTRLTQTQLQRQCVEHAQKSEMIIYSTQEFD